jgi:hypothetical protein
LAHLGIGQTIHQALEAGVLDCDYILGARMRSNKEVREVVLADRSAYLEIHPERQRYNAVNHSILRRHEKLSA